MVIGLAGAPLGVVNAIQYSTDGRNLSFITVGWLSSCQEEISGTISKISKNLKKSQKIFFSFPKFNTRSKQNKSSNELC